MKKTKVDLVFSVGSSCRTRYNLKANGLRYFSSPLDWMLSYSLDTVLTLYRTQFKFFFQNREIIPGSASGHKHVRDINTGMVSIHHFPYETDSDKFYENYFSPSMLHKFSVLNYYIKKSHHIMLVSDRNDDVCTLSSFLHEFSELYSCKITMMNIRNGGKENFHTCQVYTISRRCTLIDHCIYDEYANRGQKSDNIHKWKGNIAKWSEILSTIEYSFPALFKFTIANLINRFIHLERIHK